METLAETTATAVIAAPIEKIDLAEWLFTLSDAEYQACSPAHIAAGSGGVAKNGRRTSINVEQVADNFLVQHYIEDIGAKNHCRVESVSDSISAMGRTKLGIIWEVKVKKLTDNSCEFSNHVVVTLTSEFAALLEAAHITDLEPVKANMTHNVLLHNREETPLFAKDIEIKALKGVWDSAVAEFN
jgi:hypothetical protein